MGLERDNFDFEKVKKWFVKLWQEKHRAWVFHNANLICMCCAVPLILNPSRDDLRYSGGGMDACSSDTGGYGLDEQVRRRPVTK
jgi:hypothetical protein